MTCCDLQVTNVDGYWFIEVIEVGIHYVSMFTKLQILMVIGLLELEFGLWK